MRAQRHPFSYVPERSAPLFLPPLFSHQPPFPTFQFVSLSHFCRFLPVSLNIFRSPSRFRSCARSTLSLSLLLSSFLTSNDLLPQTSLVDLSYTLLFRYFPPDQRGCLDTTPFCCIQLLAIDSVSRPVRAFSSPYLNRMKNYYNSNK